MITYDENCRAIEDFDKARVYSKCRSYKGASGDPVVVTANLGDIAEDSWQEETRAYYVGNIANGIEGENSHTIFSVATYNVNKFDAILAKH